MRTDTNAELISISLGKNQTISYLFYFQELSTQHRKNEVSEMTRKNIGRIRIETVEDMQNQIIAMINLQAVDKEI